MAGTRGHGQSHKATLPQSTCLCRPAPALSPVCGMQSRPRSTETWRVSVSGRREQRLPRTDGGRHHPAHEVKCICEKVF